MVHKHYKRKHKKANDDHKVLIGKISWEKKEYWVEESGNDGAKRHKIGGKKYNQENRKAHQRKFGIDTEDHTNGCGHSLTPLEIG